MNLLLTGATGFVGLNVLLAALRSGRYARIDLPVRDPAKLTRQLAFEGHAPLPPGLRVLPWSSAAPTDVDHVVHCAGVLFARDRDAYFRVNVDDTMRLLASAPARARLLVLSSQSAGGPTPAGQDARTNADPDMPLTWYGESKLAMERRLIQARPDAMIWRPPMILGPRDRATLPLFRMAAGPVRIKPGLRPKTYSWIAVEDLVSAMFTALGDDCCPPAALPSPLNCRPLFVAAPDPITDVELTSTAAAVMNRRGVALPVPHPLLRVVSAFVDAVPSLREATPSLTRDRAREIFPNRWVVDAAEFRRTFAPPAFSTLAEALAATHAWNVRAGLLPEPAGRD